MEMEFASNVARVVVTTQLRMWIMMYVRAVVERILWNIVVPHLARITVSWLNVKIMEYVEYKYRNGYLIPNTQKDISVYALIAGHIEVY